jgi:hypothetical protein
MIYQGSHHHFGFDGLWLLAAPVSDPMQVVLAGGWWLLAAPVPNPAVAFGNASGSLQKN